MAGDGEATARSGERGAIELLYSYLLFFRFVLFIPFSPAFLFAASFQFWLDVVFSASLFVLSAVFFLVFLFFLIRSEFDAGEARAVFGQKERAALGGHERAAVSHPGLEPFDLRAVDHPSAGPCRTGIAKSELKCPSP